MIPKADTFEPASAEPTPTSRVWIFSSGGNFYRNAYTSYYTNEVSNEFDWQLWPINTV